MYKGPKKNVETSFVKLNRQYTIYEKTSAHTNSVRDLKKYRRQKVKFHINNCNYTYSHDSSLAISTNPFICASKAHNRARSRDGIQLLGLLAQLVMGPLVVDKVNCALQSIT